MNKNLHERDDVATLLPANAHELLSVKEIEAMLDRLGNELTERVRGENPVMLTVLHGGMVFAAHLIMRLPFALELGAVAVTRYGHKMHGSELQWIMNPSIALEGRVVVLVDDILDEGVTIAALQKKVMSLGARQCLTVVMLQKDLGRPASAHADWVGAVVPNEYVFGFGLDMGGLWRNLPSIYAIHGQQKS